MKNNLINQRFGRLLVTSDSGRRSTSRDVLWQCRCSCGREVVINGKRLLGGTTKSCGCLQRELLSARSTKHGGRNTRLYRIWCAMKTRCTDPNTRDWKNYGARGITVCNEWMNDFATFKDWALSSGYSDDLTIDRIDNDMGYCPQNCRWATRAEQNRNKRATQRGASHEGSM